MHDLVVLLFLLAAVVAEPQWVFNYDALGHPGGVAIFNNAAPTRHRASHGFTSYQDSRPSHGYTSYPEPRPSQGYISYQESRPSHGHQHAASPSLVAYQQQYEYQAPQAQYSQDVPRVGSIEAARSLAQAQDTSRGLPQIIQDTPEVQQAKVRFAEEYEKAALLSARKASYY